MGFQSILGWNKPKEIKYDDIVMPKYFYDLNLNLVVDSIMGSQKLYDIRRFYYEKAAPEDITYRSEVMHDIENDKIFQSITDFALGMRTSRKYLDNIQESKIDIQMQKWKLDSACQYIQTVERLANELEQSNFTSQGFKEFTIWLKEYKKSSKFQQLKVDTEELKKQFDDIKYNITIKRDRVIIEPGFLEEDYCREQQNVFTNLESKEHHYISNPFATVALSAFEKKILEVMKKTNKEVFKALSEYDAKYNDFINRELTDFETEVQFYMAFRLYRDEMQELNYHFSYPEFSESEFIIQEGYDLALARVNAQRKKEVIYNDCCFMQGEQFLVITGPNQGGKTTYARAMGQILYFATIGLMVPASSARIPMFDGIYTHFATEESMETGAGKLKEELVRLNVLMNQVTKKSFVIINEIFTSATSYDAYIMGKRVIDYFIDTQCFGIYVTHIHELTRGDDRIVSMVASLVSEDSNIRSFKIDRKAADGRSYANTIVEKYHMTYEEIKERIKR